MNKDMCVPCEEGILNIRVGAIIMKDGKFLMVGNERSNYLYSVGGRIKFGETAEEAIVREVLEETGVKMEIDRLGFVHENYFYGDAPTNLGKLIYEISFFFYMKVPQDFAPISESFTEDQSREFLKWVCLDEKIKMYPTFFKTELRKSPVLNGKNALCRIRRRCG
ncbi:MAG: NUDIX domain-containing protein [Oscillospiraceae bacterium]|nr:NUDIX domain-containing protein [Oscillospiraceae bacterium]